MKKTLIAVAALAATSAFAQNVTITGTFDATYRMQSNDRVDGLTFKSSQLGKDGIGTTAINFMGTEDLGGGLKASFFYEYDFEPYDANADSSFTSAAGSTVISSSQGQIYVGLDGAFGSFKMGAPNTPSLSVQGARGGAFGTKDGGRANNAGFGTSLTRFDRSFNYTTPTFSGFSAGLTYVPKSDTAYNSAAGADGTGAKMDVGAFYANGPIYVGVSSYAKGFDKTAGADSGSKIEQTQFVGSYNFGMFKVGAGGHTHKTKSTTATTAENSGYNVFADFVVTPALTLSANIQKFDDKLAGGSNLDKDSVAVGAQYALSKRTLAYARYITVGTDNGGATVTKDLDTFLVGLRHNF